MLFPVSQDGGPACLKCGQGGDTVTTLIQLPNQEIRDITICTVCWFRSILGEEAWAKALGTKEPVKSEVPPPPIAPKRFFGLF